MNKIAERIEKNLGRIETITGLVNILETSIEDDLANGKDPGKNESKLTTLRQEADRLESMNRGLQRRHAAQEEKDKAATVKVLVKELRALGEESFKLKETFLAASQTLKESHARLSQIEGEFARKETEARRLSGDPSLKTDAYLATLTRWDVDEALKI